MRFLDFICIFMIDLLNLLLDRLVNCLQRMLGAHLVLGRLEQAIVVLVDHIFVGCQRWSHEVADKRVVIRVVVRGVRPLVEVKGL